MSLSSTFSQLPSYTAWPSYSIPSSYTSSPYMSYISLSMTPSYTESPSYTASPSYSLSHSYFTTSPSYTESPSYSLSHPPFTISPSLSISPSATRSSNLPQVTGNFLSNLSDGILVTIICVIIFIQVYSCVSAMHYYNALNDEKAKRRLVNDPVQVNPYHTSVRDTINRV